LFHHSLDLVGLLVQMIMTRSPTGASECKQLPH
jgi:hypothetical protein